MRVANYPIPSEYRLVLILVLGLLAFGSCKSTSTYLKTAPNTPFLEEKGEVQITTHFGANHIESSVAVAPTNHLAIITNGYLEYRSQTLAQWDFGSDEILNAYELGLGYWTTLNDNKYTLETFLGYGKGNLNLDYYNSFDNQNGSDNFSLSTSHHKIFLQSNLGTRINERSKLGFTLKGAWLHYPNYEYDWNRYVSGVSHGFGPVAKDSIDLRNVNGFILDPVFTYRYQFSKHLPQFACQLQVGYSLNFLKINSNYELRYSGPRYRDDPGSFAHPRFQRMTLNFGITYSPSSYKKPEKRKLLPYDSHQPAHQ